jgi:hypothetical protein
MPQLYLGRGCWSPLPFSNGEEPSAAFGPTKYELKSVLEHRATKPPGRQEVIAYLDYDEFLGDLAVQFSARDLRSLQEI